MTEVEVPNEMIVHAVEDTCRICLRKCCGQSAVSLLDYLVGTDGEDASHSDELKSLRDITAQICLLHIEINDGLPEVLCEECKEGLLAAYKLQLLAQHSDSVLRKGRPAVVGGKVSDEFKLSTITVADFDAIGGESADYQETLFEQGEVVQSGEAIATAAVPGRLPTCDVCGKSFSKATFLDRHKSVHRLDPNKPFQCTVCYKRFHIEATLRVHMQLHTKAAPKPDEPDSMIVFQCPECELEFPTQEQFLDHWKSHADNGPVDIVMHDVEEVLEEDADEDADQVEEEFDHGEDASQPQQFQCIDCQSRFENAAEFCKHLSLHHFSPGKVFRCPFCTISFKSPKPFVGHLKCHHVASCVECAECALTFRKPQQLKRHMSSVHGEKRDPDLSLSCHVCEKTFQTHANLKQHEARHTGEKPFACDLCPGRYSSKASLAIHIRTHTGEKPHKCPDCPAAFNTHFSLSKHKRTHTGERPYVCEVCGLGFNSSYHVRRHLRTHTGDKPYSCPYCERRFAQSNDLVKHKRTHVGKLTYQCTECLESFRLHGELREHVRQHFLEKKQREEGHEVAEEEHEQDQDTIFSVQTAS